MDFLEPDQPFSVADVCSFPVQAASEEIHGRGRLPILAGGTGLYLDAFLTSYQLHQIRGTIVSPGAGVAGKEKGPDYLHRLLGSRLTWLHPNNMGRVIRALEIYQLTGIPMGWHQAQSRQEPPDFQSCMIGLDWTGPISMTGSAAVWI